MSLGIAICVAACSGPERPAPVSSPSAAGRPLGVDHGTLVLLDGAEPTPLTLVGPEGACAAQVLEPTADGLRVVASCAPVVALSAEAPDARLVPLRFEALRFDPTHRGRGRVGSAESWTVRLEYGPAEGDCPGLPGHAQVKLGTQPVLRQNTWLRVDRIHLLTTGERAWLLLLNAHRGEAISLDGQAETVSWTYPSGVGVEDPCAPDEVQSPSP